MKTAPAASAPTLPQGLQPATWARMKKEARALQLGPFDRFGGADGMLYAGFQKGTLQVTQGSTRLDGAEMGAFFSDPGASTFVGQDVLDAAIHSRLGAFERFGGGDGMSYYVFHGGTVTQVGSDPVAVRKGWKPSL